MILKTHLQGSKNLLKYISLNLIFNGTGKMIMYTLIYVLLGVWITWYVN